MGNRLFMILAFVVVVPTAAAAQDLQSKYVGQTGCTPDLRPALGTNGIRLDRTQRAV
jgi:hypothetical protein